jgi:hypothetical protein
MNGEDTIGSSGRGRRRFGGSPASSSPVLAGETAGEVHVVTQMRFGPEERWERPRQVSSTAPGS